MKRTLMIMLGAAILLISQGVTAQDRFRGEIRSGVAFPTQELGEADLSTGFGFEGTLSYRFMPHLAGYAGWGWHHFSVDQSFAAGNDGVEETGYTFGLQFIHPLGSSPLSYFVRAGGVYNHLDLENDEGDIIADSGHGLGWQLGAGVVVPLGERWDLMPGIRYRALSRDIELENVS